MYMECLIVSGNVWSVIVIEVSLSFGMKFCSNYKFPKTEAARSKSSVWQHISLTDAIFHWRTVISIECKYLIKTLI